MNNYNINEIINLKSRFNKLNDYYKYLILKFNSNIFYNNWNYFKSDWRIIQSVLLKGRISPFTGRIWLNKFKSELFRHNMTPEQYYCDLHNIPITQHYCKNCNKPVNFYERSFYYPDYCSKSCTGKIRGKLCGGAGSKVGGYCYVSKELSDKYNWTEEQRLNHNNRVKEIKSHGWHGSKAEKLLGQILNKLNIKFIKEYNIPNMKYRADYYLPDYNSILECDGAFKWNNYKLDEYFINRANEINKLTGIIVHNIYQYDIYYYNKYTNKLLDLINTKHNTSEVINH